MKLTFSLLNVFLWRPCQYFHLKAQFLGTDAFVLGPTLYTMDFLPHIMQIDRIGVVLTVF